jgi:HK97 family phage prohead protease
MKRKAQSFTFQKSEWTLDEARTWLTDHEHRTEKVQESDTAYTFEQFPKEQGAEGSFEAVLLASPKGVSSLECDVTRAFSEVAEDVDTFTAVDPKILAMMLKRTEPRDDERVIFLRGCDAVVKADDANNGRLRFTITTDSEDRMGDVIDPKGWFFGNYEKNPIVLFNHEYGEVAGSPPSQGKTLLIEKSKHGLEAVVEFHRKTRFNDELYGLYRDGYMSTTSVGFWPMDKPEERETKSGGHGLLFKKQDLLEWSLVAVPANPEAFAMAMQKGILRPRVAEFLQSKSAPYADRTGDLAHGENRHKAAQEQNRMEDVSRSLSAALALRTLSNRRMGA